MKVNQNQGLDPQQTLFFDDNNDTFGIHDYESRQSSLSSPSNLEPIRIEAESLDLYTYRVVDNHSGSGGKIITLLGSSALETGTASYVFAGEQGDYDVILGYYDENDGQARLQVEKNDALLDDWRLERDLPSNVGDRQTLTSRQVAVGISLQPGDTFKITGTETELEHARVDYLEFRPNHTSPIIDAGLANDTGMSATDGRTFDPTIRGKIDDDGEISSLKARFDSDQHFIDVTAQIHPDGSFSLDRHQLQVINNDHPLADGPYMLDLIATDQAGNTSDITPVSFFLDTTPPGIHLTGLEDNSTITSSSLLSGSVTEEMVMLTYRFNNGYEIEVAIGDRFFAQKFDLASLHEGRNHLAITATDKAGNVHTQTKTVHVDLLQDKEPPNLIAVLTRDTGRVMPQDTITSEVLIVGFVNDSSGVSNFQGSLAGNNVKLDLTDLIRERGRFKIDEEKLAEINGGVPLVDGSYVLNLTATDAEGNVTDVVPVSFILDTTNPIITAGLANDTGMNNEDRTTNDPTIAGNVRDLNSFDSILVGFSTTPRSELIDIKDLVQADGNFVLSAEQLAEINGNTSLPDGSYILHILATDIAGNSAKTLDIAFRLDTTPPQLQLTTPIDNGTITTDSQLSGTVNEAATLTYRLNDGTEIPLILDRDRQFQQDIVLAPGQQTLTITATDRAGNVTTEVVNVEVANPTPTDTTPPIINASLVVDSGMDNNDRLTNEAAIEGAVIDQSAIASFKAGLNNSDAASLLDLSDLLQSDGSFVLDEATLTRLNGDRSLADGDYLVNLMATDAAGNESELPVAFTLDTTAPTIDLAEPLNNSAIAADNQLVGTVDEDMVMLTYRFNNGVEVDVSLQNRNFSQALDTAGLPIGANSLTLTAIDKAGNVSEETITVIVADDDRDLVPPVISAALATDSGIDNSDRITNKAQITGNVSDDREIAAVMASLDEIELDITELIQPNGSFVLDEATLTKLNNDLPLADEGYVVNLMVTDTAGNESEFDLAFSLDTTPPVVDLVTPAANSQVVLGTQLTGSVNEDITSLTYRLGDDAEISLSLDRTREFTQTLDLEGVASGQQTITFTATDIAGNTSSSTVEVEIVADDGNIPVLNADLANDTGNSNSDRLTLDPTVTGQIISTQKIDTLMG
ncbi:MAG: Ig-like domain-containing protein, partial [Cyanobacteria bacterium J06631_2]